MSLTALLLYFRESANPFVEQAIQFSVAAAKATITDKKRMDLVDKLLLQGCKASLSNFAATGTPHRYILDAYYSGIISFFFVMHFKFLLQV